MPPRNMRIALIGMGNLGRRFIELIRDKATALNNQYGLSLTLVGVADSRGAAHDTNGLDLPTVLKVKAETGTVAEYPRAGNRDFSALQLVRMVDADVVCEATPVNIAQGGEPALSCIRAALMREMHVVTPNKGPMVLAYRELVRLADEHGVSIRFDGTVAGGLPALSLGTRDLRGATIDALEAVPNLVTGYILDLIAAGVSWEEALVSACNEGVLEADSAWDLEGWDAAAKLVILANAVLDMPAELKDVDRTGIVGISPSEVRAQTRDGRRMRLLATARRADATFALKVEPIGLPVDHPLGSLGCKEMGIVYHTDIFGTITAIIKEETPLPSAATILRDILELAIDGTA